MQIKKQRGRPRKIQLKVRFTQVFLSALICLIRIMLYVLLIYIKFCGLEKKKYGRDFCQIKIEDYLLFTMFLNLIFDPF